MRRTTLLMLIVGMITALLGAPAAALPDAVADTSSDRLTLLSDTSVDARIHELVFATPYLDAPTYVRVMLPTGYQDGGRYPVLLLLDGCCNAAPQARDWTNPAMGNAEARATGRRSS